MAATAGPCWLPRALPGDVLERILAGCDAGDLVRVGATCRALAAAAGEARLWRRQLCALGIEPPSTATTAAELRAMVAVHGGRVGAVDAGLQSSWGLAGARPRDRACFRPAPFEPRPGVARRRAFFAVQPAVTIAWRFGRDWSDGRVAAWDTRTGRLLAEDERVPWHQGDDCALVAGGAGWALMTPLQPWREPPIPARLVALAADHLGRVTEQPLPPPPRPDERLLAVDDAVLLLARGPAGLRLWDAAAGAELGRFEIPAAAPAPAPDAAEAHVAWRAGALSTAWVVAMPAAGTLLLWARGAPGPSRCVRVADDGPAPRRTPSLQLAGNAVWLWADDLFPTAWDAHSLALRTRLVGHRGPVNSLVVAGALAATGGDDGTVRLWRLPDGQGLGVVTQEVLPLPPRSPRWHERHGHSLALSDHFLPRVPAGTLCSHTLVDADLREMSRQPWMHSLETGDFVFTDGPRVVMRVPAGAAGSDAWAPQIAQFWSRHPRCAGAPPVPLRAVALEAGSLVTFSSESLRFRRWRLAPAAAGGGCTTG